MIKRIYTWLRIVGLIALLADGRVALSAPDGVAPSGVDQSQGDSWRERFDEDKDAAFDVYLDEVKRRAEVHKEQLDDQSGALVLVGRIVDQDGNPVPDAEIHAVVHEERVIGIGFYRLQATKRPVHARSEPSGQFTMNGGVGRWISVQAIEAPGYVFDEGQQHHLVFYADAEVAVLNPSARPVGHGPAEFVLWKQQGAPDQLVDQEVHLRIPQDGKRYLFNVFRPTGRHVLVPVDGMPSPLDGDVIISIVPQEPAGSVHLRIEAVDGGLAEVPCAGFIAPDEGYTAEHRMDISAGDQRHAVFIRSRGGRVYTRMTIDAWYDHEKQTAAVGLTYVSNPVGRPNLQPGGETFPSHQLNSLPIE